MMVTFLPDTDLPGFHFWAILKKNGNVSGLGPSLAAIRKAGWGFDADGGILANGKGVSTHLFPFVLPKGTCPYNAQGRRRWLRL
jgi:hypothetical protein